MDLVQGFVLGMRSLGMGSGGLVVCYFGDCNPSPVATGKPSGNLKRTSDVVSHRVEVYV